MAKKFRLAIVGGLFALSACTVHQSTAPTAAQVGGTTTFALSFDMTATPDSISQDGASQSSIVVTAHGPSGAPQSGVSVRLSMVVNGVTQDFGTLSARTLVTDSNGKATAIYTAPPNSPTLGGSGTLMTIVASAIGTNTQASDARTVEIHLVPPGVILPPAQTPVALFTVSPTPVNFNIAAIFDASTSCAVPLVSSVCPPSIPGTPTAGSIVSYSWNFGDGATASGRTATHTYVGSTQPTTGFSATLTVTNDRGLSASSTQNLSVSASPAPTGDWIFSPAAPTVGGTVLFNADAVRAAPGHTIVQYSWNFGDPFDATPGSGFQSTHIFTRANTYTVVLSVIDDAGQKATLPHTLTIGTGLPIPVLTLTKISGLSVRADAGGSTAAAGFTIKNYAFTWDDGTVDSGTASFATHTFAAGGSHTVTLVVTDDATPTPHTNSTSQNITVP